VAKVGEIDVCSKKELGKNATEGGRTKSKKPRYSNERGGGRGGQQNQRKKRGGKRADDGGRWEGDAAHRGNGKGAGDRRLKGSRE